MTLAMLLAVTLSAAAPEAEAAAEEPNRILAYKRDTLTVLDMEGAVVGRREISTLPEPPVVVGDHPGGVLVTLRLSETETLVLSPLQLELSRKPRAVTAACDVVARADVSRGDQSGAAGALGSGDRCN
ncbi:MAG: hypothetical protein RKE49_12495 [Oceanicaulis sp.]